MKTQTMTLSTSRRRALGLSVLIALAGAAVAQDQVRLHPQQDRISDQAVHADLQHYDATQGRIQALNDAGRTDPGLSGVGMAPVRRHGPG